jgi:hypothetical protein
VIPAEPKNTAAATAVPPATIAQPGRRLFITITPQHRKARQAPTPTTADLHVQSSAIKGQVLGAS